MARYYRGRTDWGQFHEAIEKERAALRDLVAQAERGDTNEAVIAAIERYLNEATLLGQTGRDADLVRLAWESARQRRIVREDEPALCPEHHRPDCSLILNGCDWPNRNAARLDGAR